MLLGRPGERSARRPETWTWELGSESSYPVDSLFLAVVFSSRGRVKRAHIYEG